MVEDKWALVLEALDKALAELDGSWPVPYQRLNEHPITRFYRMRGYSRERGRRRI